eukprot:Em0011g399a
MFSEKPPAVGIRDLSIMALALDLTRMILSLPYKLDSIMLTLICEIEVLRDWNIFWAMKLEQNAVSPIGTPSGSKFGMLDDGIEPQVSAGFVIVDGQNQLLQSCREEKRTERIALLNSYL